MNMKLALGITGVICLVLTILGGLYVGLWVCLIGGIVQVAEACKADPVESLGIAIGLVRAAVFGIAAIVVWVVGTAISALFFNAASKE